MSNLEEIRRLALEESARQADEKRKKEEARANGIIEARKLAKKHLSLWINAIEMIMRHDVKSPPENLYYQMTQGGYSWSDKYSKKWGPPIWRELNSIPKGAFAVYAEDLTTLLGSPFRIEQIEGEYQYHGGHFTIKWQ